MTFLGISSLDPAHSEERPVTITNFKYGIVCDPNDGREICIETAEIPYTDTGRCVYDHQVHSCTRYGFSFDYTIPADVVTIECIYSSSALVSLGNPQEILEEDVFDSAYTLELRGMTGHFFNPQYALYERGDAKELVEIVQTCSYEGNELFKFTLRLF